MTWKQAPTPADEDVPPEVFLLEDEGEGEQRLQVHALHQQPEVVCEDAELEEGHGWFTGRLGGENTNINLMCPDLQRLWWEHCEFEGKRWYRNKTRDGSAAFISSSSPTESKPLPRLLLVASVQWIVPVVSGGKWIFEAFVFIGLSGSSNPKVVTVFILCNNISVPHGPPELCLIYSAIFHRLCLSHVDSKWVTVRSVPRSHKRTLQSSSSLLILTPRSVSQSCSVITNSCELSELLSPEN